ncbi:MAG: SAM-dependent methyltransferase, partial [Candidatus Gastranaerophilales bacterium]|nr:SAM-dependent methyltransferase [Candidatus Gastranaerophilales bacterium]
MNTEVLVSEATKKNWKRLNVDSTDLHRRLSKRANKRFSKKTFIPVEYFSNSENIQILEEILAISKDIKTTIYSLGVNLLSANKLLNSDNPYITDILKEFHTGNPDEKLLKIKIPQEEKDFIGIVYQSLLSEGTKNQKGSYYTPQKIINEIDFNPLPNTKFLDPCCGTGSFLLFAADKIKDPKNIYGCDLDKTACFIAKINLIIKYKNIKFRPNIFNCDFLLSNKIKDKFDIIGTNPPWGAVT